MVKARDVNRRIERLGGKAVRQVGSHRRYAVVYVGSDGRDGRAFTTVPQHAGDVPAGTIRAIERDLESAFGAGWLRGV
jgi:predicted RNA binding protein YcfA (HicA-like mRNA interferase family)